MDNEELKEHIDHISNSIGEYTGYTFNDKYIENNLIGFLNKYGGEETLTSFGIAVNIYFKHDKPKESFSTVLEKVGGILYNRKNSLEPKKWSRK